MTDATTYRLRREGKTPEGERKRLLAEADALVTPAVPVCRCTRPLDACEVCYVDPVAPADSRDGLLPCPFCGGDCSTVYHSLEATWSVGCDMCFVGMAYVGVTEDEAVAAWNTRQSLANPNEAMVERAARALCSRLGRNPNIVTTAGGRRLWEDHGNDARACLTAAMNQEVRNDIDHCGWVSVPEDEEADRALASRQHQEVRNANS